MNSMNPMQFGMPQVFPPFGLPALRNPQPPLQLAPPLYVGDLDENIREEALYDLFSKFGQIYYIRLMRDPATGNSRGFAYVNFVNPREAETAMSLAQGEKLGKKCIRIMFKRPNIKGLAEGNVFIKNIDKHATVKELLSFIQMKFVDKTPAPRVLSAKLAVNSQGECLGYGYVQFESKDQAQIAIDSLKDEKFKEQILEANHFVPRNERPSKNKNNLYIKHLPEINEETLKNRVKDIFSQFGEIDQMVVKKDQKIGKFYSFVCYHTAEDAQKAVDNFASNPENPFNKELPENERVPLFVGYSQTKQERAEALARRKAESNNANNLFLKNLKPETTKEQLKELFTKYGDVISTAVKKWESASNTKGLVMGFVAFKTPQDAVTARNEAPDNAEIKKLYSDDKVVINPHQTKPQRSKFLQAQFRTKHMMQNQPQFAFGANQDMQRHIFSPIRRLPNLFPGPYGMPGPMQGGAVGPSQRMGGMGGQSMNRKPGGPRPQGPYQNRGQRPPQQGGPMGNRGPMDMARNRQQQGGPQPMDRQQGGMPKPQHQAHKPEMAQSKPQTSVNIFDQTKPAGMTSGGASSITVADLKNKWTDFIKLDKEKQRNILGELLFPLIKDKVGDSLAPKITGMLIDLDVLEIQEIFEFLEDLDLLHERIEEAKQLILSENQ